MDIKNELSKIIRFGITGTLSSLLHYGIFCLLLLWANYNIAYTAGYGAGLILNYFLTTYFTFRQQASVKNVFGFAMSHLVNYLLEIALLNAFVWQDCDEWLAALLVLTVVVPVNFVILRIVVYAKCDKPIKYFRK